MIIQKNSRKLKKIAKKYNLKMVLVFGSAVTEKIHPESDIDIAVLGESSDLSLKAYSDLLLELQRIFGDREVDLAFLNRADPLFLKKIVENCELIYGSSRELARLKALAFKRYTDHKKYFDMEREFAKRFIRQNLERMRS